jgi:CHAT domain-containing protein/tetratricopeptide (TPR) repeat protein
VLSCSRADNPALDIESTNRLFVIGDLQNCREQAHRRFEQLRSSNPHLAWKFRVLEARAALWQGDFAAAKALASGAPQQAWPDIAISTSTVLGIVDVHARKFDDAERALGLSSSLCASNPGEPCGDVLQALGLLASERGDSAGAEELYKQTLLLARSHGDTFMEATALANLGAESISEARFDEALDRSEESYQAAQRVDARIIKLVAEGNIGWAAYRLGDSDRALSLLLEAESEAARHGDLVDQGVWLTSAGYVYMDSGNIPLAERSFQQALALEEKANRKEHIFNALRALARLYMESGNDEKAEQYAKQALAVAKEGQNPDDVLYPELIRARLAGRRGERTEAEAQLRTIRDQKQTPPFLRWEAGHFLAQLYGEEKKPGAAQREYLNSLSTFESARSQVKHEDFQAAFLTNGWPIYDDFVHFLVAHGRSNDALRWAEYSRARMLAGGLGLVAQPALGKSQLSVPPALNAEQIARRADGSILFYWLGVQTSYLWVITPQVTKLFVLPSRSQIESVAQRYRRALTGPQDGLAWDNSDGHWLYATLVQPAETLINANRKVYIIPDGSLNNLGFDALLPDAPPTNRSRLSSNNDGQATHSTMDGSSTQSVPHFWIDDVLITNASSLRILEASLSLPKPLSNPTPRGQSPKLLLIGNSVAPNAKYPELPKAAAQMDAVARHFPSESEQVFTRQAATPKAYLGSRPERYSYIHFVAHGTASRLSPLDSAIILSKADSKNSAEEDSYKLYARDIIRAPLRAELVTIAACYGAGERTYSGEGLVGLSWAFLMAGAHNVVAALWEASDAPTERLMDLFYDEVSKGTPPDVALRKAKLSLLHGSAFRSPFYWAPFQLYAGTAGQAHAPGVGK